MIRNPLKRDYLHKRFMETSPFLAGKTIIDSNQLSCYIHFLLFLIIFSLRLPSYNELNSVSRKITRECSFSFSSILIFVLRDPAHTHNYTHFLPQLYSFELATCNRYQFFNGLLFSFQNLHISSFRIYKYIMAPICTNSLRIRLLINCWEYKKIMWPALLGNLRDENYTIIL